MPNTIKEEIARLAVIEFLSVSPRIADFLRAAIREKSGIYLKTSKIRKTLSFYFAKILFLYSINLFCWFFFDFWISFEKKYKVICFITKNDKKTKNERFEENEV